MTTAETRPVLFDSPGLRVLDFTLPGDDSVLVVTFPARTERQFLHRKGFGQDFFRRQRISAVHITAAWNHWFQVPETEAALAAVRRVAMRFRRVTTYGSSMGGYAAAACSGAIGAHAVLSLSPQASIDPAKVPWEPRWARDARCIAAGPGFVRDDMARLLAPTAALHVAYDPRTRDRLHAERLFAASRDPRPLALPFAGHPAGHALLAAGEIKPWVLGVVRGEDVSGVRARFRGARAGLPSWWHGLARAAGPRRRALALAAAREARRLAPENAGVAYSAARSLEIGGAMAEALEAFAVACAAKPTAWKYRQERAALLLRSGRAEDALADFDMLVAALPGTPAPLAGRAEALARLGRRAEARVVAEQAVARGAPERLRLRIERHLAAAGRAAAARPTRQPAA